MSVVEKCSARTSFQLTYERASERREFHEDGITGGTIADAFSDGRAPGEWSSGGALFRVDNEQDWTEEHVFAVFFTSAVTEAVHEALEWFKIDGVPALDPHGRSEADIYRLTEAFAAALWALSPFGEQEGSSQKGRDGE